jgi:hypothetical protein
MNYINTQQLNLDIKSLKTYCLDISPLIHNKWRHNIVQDNELLFPDISLTSLHAYYNLLLFPNKELHKLYFHIRELFYKTRVHDGEYYISMWCNIHYNGQNLDWHSHNPPEHNAYHGYFAVDAEPSKTTYMLPDGTIEEVNNKNNQLVISRSDGDKHCVSVWNEERPRVTLAFDIIQVNLANGSLRHEDRTNNWMPI